MKTIATFAALWLIGSSGPASAQQPEHRLGEHPAVMVKRQQAQKTYDYAAQFYPHPAWLYLEAEAPRPMMQHPAVIVAERARREAQERAAATLPAPVAARLH